MFHSKITQEFAQAVADAETLSALGSIVDAPSRDIGFRYFAFTHHVDLPRAPQPAIRLHNYPTEWGSWFDAERLGPSDPVHRASHLTQVGFRWSMLPQLIHLTPRDQYILERARLAGLGDGFTVPAHVALKGQILQGSRPPGSALEPAQLGVELASSITPARDALHRLVGERLVETPEHDGFRVPRISEAALRDLYAWNAAVLGMAARRLQQKVRGMQ